MEPGEKADLVERFVALMQRIWARARPTSTEEWSEVELTMAQFKTLMLMGRGPQRMGDVARLLGVGLSSATSAVDRLVGKGLVDRRHDPADRRTVVCSLTASGQEEVNRFWRIGRARIEGMAEALIPEELDQVVRAMEILDGALAARGDAPTAGGGKEEASG